MSATLRPKNLPGGDLKSLPGDMKSLHLVPYKVASWSAVVSFFRQTRHQFLGHQVDFPGHQVDLTGHPVDCQVTTWLVFRALGGRHLDPGGPIL